MEVVGDRWSILLLREAYYGTRRFDEFQYYLGVAPNILSARLKKFVDLGMMTRVRLPEHGGRHEYVLTKKGRDFFPTYLALKKWGDDWLAAPEGPQVVFRDRSRGRPIEYPTLMSRRGKPLELEDVDDRKRPYFVVEDARAAAEHRGIGAARLERERHPRCEVVVVRKVVRPIVAKPE